MTQFKQHKSEEELSLTVSVKSFIRIFILIAVGIMVWNAAHRASHALLLIFTAAFLSLALNAPVYWLSNHLPGKRRGNRALATTLSFLIVIIILGGFLAYTVPVLVKQTDNLIKAAPRLIDSIRNQNSGIGRLIRHYNLQKQVNSLSQQLSERLRNSGGTVFNTAKKVGSSIFSLLTILVLTFMMLVEGPRWVNMSRTMVPDKHYKMIDRMTYDMYRVIKGFVNGQVILAAIASAFIIPAVLLLHISYPAALIVVIFVCGLIPMVGHTIGAVIVTIVALFHSTTSAGIILLYYITYQQLENYLIQPRVQANSTNMSPLLVFMSVIIGLSFGGILGGLVAIPIGGCLRIAVLEYLRSQKLIDTPEFESVTHETK
jgi:predicted PurR-regulated permease PerM